ncbi:MAG TPA: hypothetical protein VGF28_09165 [Thermoanaerobaculia bacterium]|jgi:hypothetical protein
MKHLLRLSLVVAFLVITAPAAFAYEPDRDWAPSDPCGSIDADRACWLTLGVGSCPENTSKTKCLARCDCFYENNKKKCGSNAYCQQTALAELKACRTNCGIDWVAFIPASGGSLDPVLWAGTATSVPVAG